MSLYSLYGEVSGDSVQILTEAPPCISKFGRPYRPSYVFDSPYMIPPFKKVRNIRPAPTLQIMDRDIDERTNVDINPLRGLEDPRGFDEFDQWFAGAITVDRTIRQSHKFFEILLGHDALGWLGDEVSFFKCFFLIRLIYYFYFKPTCFYSATAHPWVLAIDKWKTETVSKCHVSTCHAYRYVFLGNDLTELVINLSISYIVIACWYWYSPVIFLWIYLLGLFEAIMERWWLWP